MKEGYFQTKSSVSAILFPRSLIRGTAIVALCVGVKGSEIECDWGSDCPGYRL